MSGPDSVPPGPWIVTRLVRLAARWSTRIGERQRSSRFTGFYRIGLPIALWIVFVNVASRYHDRDAAPNVALREAVEAELAARRCPGLQLDPAGFRAYARERGISHADLYQKRTGRLQRAATALDHSLRDDPAGECRRMLDLYGRGASRLLKPV